MHKILIAILILFGSKHAVSVGADSSFMKLSLYEDTLKGLAVSMITDDDLSIRQNSCYEFIRTLVKAIRIENSYSYPFDSLYGLISIISPKDNKFRIFSWELFRFDLTFRYYGCIQMKNGKALEFYPLFDNSSHAKDPETSTVSSEKWYGAYYYNIIQKKRGKKRYYCLFGFNEHNLLSNKKILDVLYFEEGVPYFGLAVFEYPDKNKVVKRLIIEYKNDASATLNYNKEWGIIVYDHLIPLNPLQEGMYEFYVPDGSYEGFKYKKGKWHYINKVFDQTFEEPPF
ncbi:MAG: hypothetical protein IIA45_09195 [Bacteroidetes bacterium]|nr:hypothetical protein [Bacteroidota bacterium]